MLPANAPMVDEDAMLDDIFAQVQASGADVIDMRDDYRANKDQYLYFKTTTTGHRMVLTVLISSSAR